MRNDLCSEDAHEGNMYWPHYDKHNTSRDVHVNEHFFLRNRMYESQVTFAILKITLFVSDSEARWKSKYIDNWFLRRIISRFGLARELFYLKYIRNKVL